MHSITVFVPTHGQLLTVATRPGEPEDHDRILRLKEFPPKATREEAKAAVDCFPSDIPPLTRRIIERTYTGDGKTFDNYKSMIERAIEIGVEVMELGRIADRQTLGDQHYRYSDGMERIDKVTKP